MPTTQATPNIRTSAHGNTFPSSCLRAHCKLQDLYSCPGVDALLFCMLKCAHSNLLLSPILRIGLLFLILTSCNSLPIKQLHCFLCTVSSLAQLTILDIVFAQYAIPQYLHTILPAHIYVPGVLFRLSEDYFLDQNPYSWFFTIQMYICSRGLCDPDLALF